jgi:hypothetical protein
MHGRPAATAQLDLVVGVCHASLCGIDGQAIT